MKKRKKENKKDNFEEKKAKKRMGKGKSNEGLSSLSKTSVGDSHDPDEGKHLLSSSSSSHNSAFGRGNNYHGGDDGDAEGIRLEERHFDGMLSTLSYSTFSASAPEEHDMYRTLPNIQPEERPDPQGRTRNIIYDSNRKKVQVIFSYRAKSRKELSLEVGDIVTVTNNADLDWWEGVLPNGKRGWFPSNYCTRLNTAEPHHARIEEGLQEIVRMAQGDGGDLDFDEGPGSSWYTKSSDEEEGKMGRRGEEKKREKKEEEEEEEEDGEGVPVTLWERIWARVSEYVYFRMMIYFLLCGIVTSLVSVGIDYTSHYAYKLRSLPFDLIVSKYVRFVYWFLFSAVLTSLGHALTKFISPFSAGSGIPEVKVIMSGVELPQYLSFRVLVGKVVGLTLALSAGLFAGKQGPMVHIGAVVATLLTFLPPFKCK